MQHVRLFESVAAENMQEILLAREEATHAETGELRRERSCSWAAWVHEHLPLLAN
jgi:hypothetical protein